METLPRTERLRGKAAIGELLKKGKFMREGCLKACVLMRQETAGDDSTKAATDDSVKVAAPVRMMVSVSKRLFKRAVKRNLLKRRLREAFRRQKFLLEGVSGCDLLLVYNSAEVADYQTIAADVAAILKNIAGISGENHSSGEAE